jgi:hypothetical protein
MEVVQKKIGQLANPVEGKSQQPTNQIGNNQQFLYVDGKHGFCFDHLLFKSQRIHKNLH